MHRDEVRANCPDLGWILKKYADQGHSIVSNCIELDIQPDAPRLAHSIAERPGAAWLWSNGRHPISYLFSDPIAETRALDPEPSLMFSCNRGDLTGVPRWLGLLPYEALRAIEREGWTLRPDTRAQPLIVHPRWWRYGAVAVISDRVRVFGDEPACMRELSRRLLSANLAPANCRIIAKIQDSEDAHHASRVNLALGHIRAGDIYQINLARRFDFLVQGSALDWLAKMGIKAPSPFGFALQSEGLRVVGNSPELCLSVSNTGYITTRPIKGTRPRGRNVEEDHLLIESLERNTKEIAELSMVIDLERNDLGRVAAVGSVAVLDAGFVETHGPVHQRVATLSAHIRPDVDRRALLETFLPSGSVTGAPKVRAMELIANLESTRRGLYTGAYGFIGHDGSMRLAMAIRTLVADEHDQGHYFAGGGIVADSIPHQELEETFWKARHILDFAGIVLSDLPETARERLAGRSAPRKYSSWAMSSL